MKALSSVEIAEIVVDEICSFSGISREDISVNQGFLELGLESLQAVNLIDRLSERLARKIEVSSIFDHPSILLLSRFLSGEDQSNYNLASQPHENSSESVAVIGMSCRFPKSPDLDSYFENLNSKINCVEENGSKRWGSNPHKSVNFFGALSDFDQFAADVFGFSEAEALRMDPQHRLILEETWTAIEDAGYSPSELRGSATGVFVGISNADYQQLLSSSYRKDIFTATGNAHSIAANGVSYFYDFRGPSIAVDTACSSSLVAAHLAVESLKRGEINLAIIAGVNLILGPDLSEAFAGAGMLSPDGRSASFSDDANGYTRGEGVGVVILKRTSDINNERVYAVIKGSSINQDGKSNGLTAPNGKAQEAVILDAIRRSNLTPSDIGYHEAHGTGTKLGDPVELLALERVHHGRPQPLLIGSAKTNIGHLEPAAGVAGLIKAVLSIYHNKIFPNLHFTELNKQLHNKIPSLQVATNLSRWTTPNRLATVSSFGFGGTNACVVVAQSPVIDKKLFATENEVLVAGFSSNSREAATKELQQFRKLIEDLDWKTISVLARATLAQRLDLNDRIVVSGSSKEELLKNIDSQTFSYSQKLPVPARVCFLFTGQGSQYTKMYYPLYLRSRSFQNRVNLLIREAQKYFPLNLFTVWTEEKYRDELLQTDYGQILLFILQLAFAEYVRDQYNVKPEFVFGHSLGEIISAVFSKILTDSDGIDLVAYRGRLMRSTLPGAMTAVFAQREDLDFLIQAQTEVDYAAFNGQELQVVSGSTKEIEKLETKLTDKSIRYRRMPVKQAFHSQLMDPILDTFEESIRFGKSSPSLYRFISSSSGELLEPNQILDSNYWKQQLRRPTQFEKAIQVLQSLKANVFIELGPTPVLNGMAQRMVHNTTTTWLHFFEGEHSTEQAFANGLKRGVGLGILRLSSDSPAFNLPKTIFAKQRYLITKSALDAPTPESSHRLLEKPEVIKHLLKTVSTLLRVSEDEVSPTGDLLDLGADSLVLMNAIQSIKDNYSVVVPVSEVFQNLNTLEKIANFVVAENSRTLKQSPITVNSQSVTAKLPTLENSKNGVLGNFKSFATNENLSGENHRKKEFLRALITQFNNQTSKTKVHVEQFRKVLADNRTSAGYRPELKEVIYPIHCHQAKGSEFSDIDGNKYIDFTMGFGVNFFGHSPEFLEKAMLEQIKLGVCIGPQSFLAGEVAKLICELTGHERTAFVNSGTEAVMTAIRLARAGTGRTKVVIFDGSYHGHFDGVLARAARDLKSVPVAAGIPSHLIDDIMVLEYGSPESLKIIDELGRSLAAVLVEPVQSRFPENQPAQFLQALRKITHAHEIAFIWDEVITGFRIHPGGAQAHFGVKADIAAYGKILGGGMPIGAIAGSEKYLDFIDGGEWHFGDSSAPTKEMTFFAGTFSKHPLAMATALATLKKLKSEGLSLTSDLNKKTDNLCQSLNRFFNDHELDIKLVNFGSLFRFKANLNLDLLFISLNKAGFYIWEGRNLFLSTAHTDQDTAAFIKAVQEITLMLIDVGYLSKGKSAQLQLPLIAPQRRFLELSKTSKFAASASHICVSAKVKGFLDPEKLKKAFNILAASRDLFGWRADSVAETQLFTSGANEIPFAEFNLRSQKSPWKYLDQQLHEFSLEQFDLKHSVPMKVRLYDVVEETHVMAIVCHHLALDGWTMTLFFEDLAEIYNSLLKNETPTIKSSLPYQKFLQAENKWGSPEQLKKAEQYWLTKFSNVDRPNTFAELKGISEESFQGQRLVFDIQLELYKPLKVFSKEQKITPFMFLLGAFAQTLMKKLNKTELIIGIPAANRDYTGADKMYGNCANLLAVKISNNFSGPIEYYNHVKHQVIEAYQNMIYPYEDLKQKTGPLFDVYFNLEPTSDLPEFDQASLIIHPYPITASEFPLMLNVTDFEYYYHCEFDFQWQKMSDDFVLELITDLKSVIRSYLLQSKI